MTGETEFKEVARGRNRQKEKPVALDSSSSASGSPGDADPGLFKGFEYSAQTFVASAANVLALQ